MHDPRFPHDTRPQADRPDPESTPPSDRPRSEGFPTSDRPQPESAPPAYRPQPESAHPGVTPMGGAMAKADLMKRFLAMLIDVVASAVVSLMPYIGGLAAAAYMLFRDGLELDFMDGRSVGKKIMKLRPVRLDGGAMDLVTSAKRNWMFALGGLTSLLLFIPILGWLFVVPVAIAGLVLGVVEVILVLTDDRARRLGDKIADTQVVEVAD